jgi:hypothetical protein
VCIVALALAAACGPRSQPEPTHPPATAVERFVSILHAGGTLYFAESGCVPWRVTPPTKPGADGFIASSQLDDEGFRPMYEYGVDPSGEVTMTGPHGEAVKVAPTRDGRVVLGKARYCLVAAFPETVGPSAVAAGGVWYLDQDACRAAQGRTVIATSNAFARCGYRGEASAGTGG